MITRRKNEAKAKDFVEHKYLVERLSIQLTTEVTRNGEIACRADRS